MGALDGFEHTVMRLTTADSNIVQTINERLWEQTKWNEELYDRLNQVFRAKVVEILDRHDAIRAEIIGRLEQLEAPACPQAPSVPAAGQLRNSALEPAKLRSKVLAATPRSDEAKLIPAEAENLSAAAAVVEEDEAMPATIRSSDAEAQDLYAALAPQLLRAREELESAVTEVRQMASRAEAASREALEACATSDRRFDEALATLRQAGEESAKAVSNYDEAQRQRVAALESYDHSRQELAEAEEALKNSASQLADAKSSAKGVLDSIRNAENEANKAITLAMGAGAKAQLAEEELRKSQHLMRRTRCWALVTLFASLSIGAWESVRAAASFHYINGVPIVVTAIATVIGVIVWRTERSD
jgi:hypothetical protein